MNSLKQVIEIKNLSYTYPDDKEALKDMNLDVSEGECIGIVGPNGAGKSTLLLHLNGILQGKGEVSVFGLEVNAKNLAQIRRKVGLVFQDPDDQLFMPTVFDDVAFGPINMGLDEGTVRVLVRETLEAVGMQDSVNRLAHHLSFGEKKRISIATVLSMKPEILVLDEPSSNLDPKARRHLIGLLSDFRLTKVIASHDLELILDICDRVIVLYRGQVVTGGGTKEILSDKSLMASTGLEVPLSLSLERPIDLLR